MRVLHVYQPNDIMANQYVAMIMKAMPHELENRKACSWEEARDIVNDWHPDIFHLHGDASPFSSHLTSLTAPRLVISPHGNLLPDSLADKAYVVIARSETEQKSLKQSYEKGRYVVILNPIITRTITPDGAARQLSAVYQRVLDSYVLERMDEPTRHLLRLLLKTAICGDRHWVEDELAMQPSLLSLPATSLQQLLLYAELEGVSQLVCLGMELLGIESHGGPSIEQRASACFVPACYVKPQPATNLGVGALIERIVLEMKHNQLSLLRLCELDRSLRQKDVDEPRLVAQLKEEKRLGLLRSLLAVLQKQTGLDEGFMPCLPQNNHETQKIENCIQNHLFIL